MFGRMVMLHACGDTLTLGPAGRYRLGREIARSSFGMVWSARWLDTGSEVAIKTVRRDKMAQATPDFRALWPGGLKREIALLESLRAPQIVRFLRKGNVEGMPVMVLEQLDTSVQRIVQPAPEHSLPVNVSVALDWLRQVAEGLRILHRAGWRHLDLKPANLLLTPDGPLGRRVKLADFGASVMLGECRHAFAGTPGWQAPEQFFPQAREAGGFRYETDQRADIHVLGLLLFHFITGERIQASVRAAGLHRSVAEIAAWDERGADWYRLVDADRERFLAALGEAYSSEDEEATWHPGMASPAAAPCAAKRALLALLEDLLALRPNDRIQNAEEARQRIEAIIRARAAGHA